MADACIAAEEVAMPASDSFDEWGVEDAIEPWCENDDPPLLFKVRWYFVSLHTSIF